MAFTESSTYICLRTHPAFSFCSWRTLRSYSLGFRINCSLSRDVGSIPKPPASLISNGHGLLNLKQVHELSFEDQSHLSGLVTLSKQPRPHPNPLDVFFTQEMLIFHKRRVLQVRTATGKDEHRPHPATGAAGAPDRLWTCTGTAPAAASPLSPPWQPRGSPFSCEGDRGPPCG